MPPRPDLIFLATTPWDGTPLTERHLAAGLAAGRRLLYVEPPHSVGRGGVAPARLRRVADGLGVIAPRSLPWRDRAAGWPLSRPLIARQVRRAARDLGLRDPLLVEFAVHRDLSGRVGERGTVAYLKDAGAAAGPLIGLPEDRLAACEDHLVRRAGLVVTPSPEIADEVRARASAVLELPPGCDAARFRRAEPDARVRALPGPRIGLVGTLNARLDWGIVDDLAAQRPGWSFVLAGPRSRLEDPAALRALARANVHELGRVDHAALPAVVAAFDAGFVPYRADDPFNVRSTPLKTLELLAAGLPVVATPIPAHRRLVGDIALATDADGFAAALDRELAVDDGARREARRARAAASDWSVRCRRLDAALTTLAAA